MRLGIFGGTFDPVHFGHLVMAEQCREQCALDEVRFVPAGRPPHKPGVRISSAKDRINMLQFALAGYPEMTVSRREVDRDGPSYTVETLQSMVDEDRSRELFLLIGSDSLADLPTWREPRRILELAVVVAVNRGDLGQANVEDLAGRLGAGAHDRIRLVEMPPIGISASDIRERVRSGRSIRFLTRRPVEQYILAHGLYIT